MIMKKNLLFILFLVMPIALIGISIYNKDIERIERAFYFLLSICGAYIMSSLKEAKNIKISKRTKKIIILSFIGALSIFVFFFLENIYLGCIIASMIAIYPFSLIYKEQNVKKQQGRILSPQLLFSFNSHSFQCLTAFFDSIHNTSCNYPCPWLHPPTGNTSDRRTIGKKQHKGLSTLKLSCPHSCHFSFCFPAVQSPPIRF